MKTITLNRMELRNFKGVVEADYTFNADHTHITGDNATGKSTIFEAYLWCLFDKNQQGNATKVQPLDEKNEVQHKLTTSVRLHLTLDTNPIIVERTLKEEWVKPRGTAELICKGTKSEYAINDVPLSKSQYNAKLEEVLPLDRWFLLSAVGIIPAMDQKTCRAALQQIAPAIDERTLAKPFPTVFKALEQGLTIDELQAIVKRQKSIVKQELDGVPAALEAQDRLRVEDDFEAVEKELEAVKESIAKTQQEIDALQSATVDEATLQQAAEKRQEIARLSQQISERQIAAQNAYNKRRSEVEQGLQSIAAETDTIARRLEISSQNTQRYLDLINAEKSRIAALRDQWSAKNAETYTPTIDTNCPTCGQPLPTERIAAAREKALQVWNTAKAESLHAIQAQAEACKQRIDQYAAANAQAAEQDAADTTRLETLQACNLKAQENLAALRLPDTILAEDEYYQAMLEQLKAIQTTEAAPATENNSEAIAKCKAYIAELTTQQEILLRRLAARDTNQRIAEERTRLEARQRLLADAMAENEGEEQQMQSYRKAKIMAVENGVSSLFTLVRWKMYEPNLTNDGEREVCTALIDGVPYEQQNRATQVNAGIDIVNAFAKAYQVSMPLFVDNAESVTNLLPTNGQCITLTVVKNSKLTIN